MGCSEAKVKGNGRDSTQEMVLIVKGLAYKHEDLNLILPCRKGRAASADNPTAKEEEAGRSLGTHSLVKLTSNKNPASKMFDSA